MDLENKRLFNIYFLIIIFIFVLVSFIYIWVAIKMGGVAGLTSSQVISLHSPTDIHRIYRGYEVLIMQYLNRAFLYFLLAIVVTIQFAIIKIVGKYKK